MVLWVLVLGTLVRLEVRVEGQCDVFQSPSLSVPFQNYYLTVAGIKHSVPCHSIFSELGESRNSGITAPN